MRMEQFGVADKIIKFPQKLFDIFIVDNKSNL